jgi:hypothetical protein
MVSFVSLKLSNFIDHLLIFLNDVLFFRWYVSILGLTFALDLDNILLGDHCFKVSVQTMLLLKQRVIIQ